MRLLQIKYLLTSVLFLSVQSKTISQALLPDTSASPAEKNAIAFYSAALTEQLHLYNGKEYQEYSHVFEEGTLPYFIKSDLSIGTVTYDGNTYDDVPLQYNVVTDDVIILGSNQITKIRLLRERVAAFSLLGHSFVNMPADSLSENMTPGFYDILIKGRMGLVARRTKVIQEYVKQKMEYKVFQKDHYYIRKNNRYFPISNKKSFVEQLGDKRKEIQQYIRKNKLRFRKDPENTMVKTVEYYNQLIK